MLNNTKLFFWRLKRSLFHHSEHMRLVERYQLKSMIRLKPSAKEVEAMRNQIEKTVAKY